MCILKGIIQRYIDLINECMISVGVKCIMSWLKQWIKSHNHGVNNRTTCTVFNRINFSYFSWFGIWLYSGKIMLWPNVAPTTLWPNVLWPNVLWPNVLWLNVLWPKVLWPNVVDPILLVAIFATVGKHARGSWQEISYCCLFTHRSSNSKSIWSVNDHQLVWEIRLFWSQKMIIS